MKPFLAHALALASMLTLASPQAVEVDLSFQANLSNGTVHSLAVASDGTIFLTGEFSTDNGGNAHSAVKLNADGSLAAGFAVDLPGSGFALALGDVGNLYTGGSFGVAGLQADGSSSFSVEANGRITCLARSEKQLVAGGTFWSQPDCFVTRLNSDGTIDSTFKSGLKLNFSLEAGVIALTIQSDGKILVGGNFATSSGFTTLARLNSDGSVDTSFSHENGPILYAKTIVVQAGGKILVGGTADSSGRGFVRRLHPDGSIDSSFTEVSLDGAAEAVALDASGRLMVGGTFRQVNGENHRRLARLSADGTPDQDWNIGANNVVKVIAVEDNGDILVGGAFSEIGGVLRSGVARLRDVSAFGLEAAAVHLSIKADAGRSYLIESSSDLQTWTKVRTNVATADGLTVNVKTGAGPRLFFRARLLE